MSTRLLLVLLLALALTVSAPVKAQNFGNIPPGTVIGNNSMTEKQPAQPLSSLTTSSGAAIGSKQSIWTDNGAAVTRLSDRLFVGAAAAVTAGNSTNTPTNWLAQAPPLTGGVSNLNYTGTYGQEIVLSTNGTLALVAGSRSSDSTATIGITQAAIGVSGYAINDNTGAGGALAPSAWAGYFEARHYAGVTGQSTGIEIDIDVDSANAPVDIFPYNQNGVGQTRGLNIAAGGGALKGSASAAVNIGPNLGNGTTTGPGTFRKGILFDAGSFDPALPGPGGAGIAMELGAGMDVRWLAPDNSTDAEIYGDANGLAVGPLLLTGIGVSTGAAGIAVGADRSASGPAYLDLHSTFPITTDFRIIRNTDGSAQISNAAGVQVQGTNTNDTAPAGMVGEFLSAASAPATPITSGTPIALTGLALAAGDWDVEGIIFFNGAPTTVVTGLVLGVSTTSGGFPAQGTFGRSDIDGSFTGIGMTLVSGRVRVSVASPVSVYLNARGNFTTSTMTAGGQITARRVR